MLRPLTALILAAVLAAPAMADTCSAATDAATRAALASAEAKGQRTATVRIACGDTRQTLVLHRTETRQGTSVTVRSVEPSDDSKPIRAMAKKDFASTSAAKVIRVPD